MATRLLKEEDKQMILDYIQRNSIETSFLYSNILKYGVENKKDIRRSADYFGFFDEGHLKGILPFYNLGSCIPHYEMSAAILPFVQIMKERDFSHLLGMDRIIRPLYQAIKDIKNIEECNDSSYFINKALTPFKIDGLEFFDPRKMKEDENVIKFIIQVRNNGFHESVNEEDVVKSLSAADAEEDAVIAARDGKMVAYASIQAYTDSISQIGSVYTAEDERGKGYCKAVVSELCSKIESRNKMPTLFVRKNNVPAVKAYSSLGFGYFDDYLFIKLSCKE